ncbi:MAG: hypothetical protein KIH69_011430 [Anaerolineae bacterium]|nr:hypothetical protein [Anaerolineae bacterium]
MYNAHINSHAISLPRTVKDWGLTRRSNSTVKSSNPAKNAININEKGVGALPVMSLIIAVGLLVVSLGYTLARRDSTVAYFTYWLGLLIIFIPSAARQLQRNVNRNERLGIVIFVGLTLHMMRTLYSPLEFKFGDEFQHWRTADDMLRTGQLFNPNPLLEVSPYFPGLENITVALVNLSGLDIFNASMIQLFMARVVFVFALVSFYEAIGCSPRVIGIASLVYMCNPHYQFINFYGYQAIGMPFALTVMYAIARLERTNASNENKENKWGLRAVIVLALCSLTITHHLTNYITIAMLSVWAVVAVLGRRIHKAKSASVWATILAVVLCFTWSFFIATAVFEYFSKPFKSVAAKFASATVGEETKEAKKQSFVLQQNPPAERIISWSSTGLLMAAAPLGAWAIWKRRRNNIGALMLGVAALGYPASWVFRLVSADGAEFTGRLGPYLFVALSFGIATAIEWLENPNWNEFPLRWLRKLEPSVKRFLLPVSFIAISIIFGGSITLGYPSITWRLPGKFIVNAFERSIEPQGVQAATWMRTTLGNNNRVTSDFINKLLLGSYGRQDAVGGLSWLFFAPNIDESITHQIKSFKLHYISVDLRLTRLLPALGVYFDADEPDANAHSKPIPTEGMRKFEKEPTVNRIFDSGDIVMYDVHALGK